MAVAHTCKSAGCCLFCGLKYPQAQAAGSCMRTLKNLTNEPNKGLFKIIFAVKTPCFTATETPRRHACKHLITRTLKQNDN